MTKKFKKIVASVMAGASLTTGAIGLSASASTATNSYSVFNWDRNGTNVSVSITNTSGASRYAQVNAYGYNSAGAYVGHIGNEGSISDNSTLSKSGTLTNATSVTFGGTLYSSTKPVGTPLATWTRSA